MNQFLSTFSDLSSLAGRILLSILFVMAGINKINDYAGTTAYFDALGIPGMLLPLVIALEVLGGLAILLGWQTRLVALLLAGFTLMTAIVAHNDFSNQMQMLMFMKNTAIAGGFLVLMASGAGKLSLDHRFAKSNQATI